MSKQRKVDFLVIGSGIAGLSYALKAAEKGKVLILTKDHESESNTKYAQGGIAAVIDPTDNTSKHVADTMIAGAGLCDEKIVNIVISEGPDCVRELIESGTRFDKNKNGDYDLAMEGGHSAHRILHYKDATGSEIERAQHHLGELITSKTLGITCYGAYVLNTRSGKIETILSKITVMATGGAGQVYASTTNPSVATGDGIAMVYRAKGHVRDMEFVQFHPTSLYNPGEHPSFLISEAVRGFGAVLRTIDGAEFMHKYDVRGCLAPRDIVARAIDNEMKMRGDDYVYLDCRHLDRKGFIDHFPTIYNKCSSEGIDLFSKLIPVIPAAHYLCGGIIVDEFGRSTLKNLYAIGECACTGLHGANRLASNSLLEALVFANRTS